MVLVVRAHGRLYGGERVRPRVPASGLVQEPSEHVFAESQLFHQEGIAYPQVKGVVGRSDEGEEEEAYRTELVQASRKFKGLTSFASPITKT